MPIKRISVRDKQKEIDMYSRRELLKKIQATKPTATNSLAPPEKAPKEITLPPVITEALLEKPDA